MRLVSNPVSKSKLTMPCPSSERSERWRGDWLAFSSWSGSSGSEVKARRTTREVKKGPLQTRLRVQRVRQATSPHRRSRNHPLESSLVASSRGPRLESSGEEGLILTVRIIRISGSDRSRNKKRKRFFPRFLHESLTGFARALAM